MTEKLGIFLIEKEIILEKSPFIISESLPQAIKLFHIETLDANHIKTIDEFNMEYTKKVIEMLGGNKTKAAELLGISRTSLWRILQRG